jgi:hypothetical protein
MHMLSLSFAWIWALRKNFESAFHLLPIYNQKSLTEFTEEILKFFSYENSDLAFILARTKERRLK